MTVERLFRHDEELGEFDWRQAARDLDIDLETAQQLVEYALHTALGNRQRAEKIYLQQLWMYAQTQNPEPPPAVPARNTESKYDAGAGKRLTLMELAQLPVGKYTQVEVAASRAEKFPGYSDWATSMQASLAAVQPVGGSSPTSVQPAADAAPGETPPAQAPRLGATAAWSGRATDRVPPSPARPHPFARKARAPDPAATIGRSRSAAPVVPVPAAAAVPAPVAVPVPSPAASAVSPVLSPPVVTAAPAAPSPAAALRQQLEAAAVVGQGAADPLAAADPDTARKVLQQLRTDDASTLRLVTQASDGAIERVLGHGSASEGLPAEHASRFAPHVGAAAAGAARLHTDAAADLVAAAHHAHAVTVGSDIYFARGGFAPGTARGDELIAHELAHVAQGQRGELTRAAAKGVDPGATLDPAEAEAELRARHAVTQLYADTAAPRLAQPAQEPAPHADRRDPERGSRSEAQPDGGSAQRAGVPVRAAPQTHHEVARANPGPARAAEPGGGAGPAASAHRAPQADLGQRAGGQGADEPGRLLSQLEAAPASSLATTLTTVQASTPQAFQSVRARAQEEMPRIQAPTGLPARADGGSRREPAPTANTSPREPTAVQAAPAAGPQRTPEHLVHEAPAPRPVAPTQLAGGDETTHDNDPTHGPEDPALARSAQSALSSVRLGADQVSTTATEVPTVEMRGETDPAQLDTAHATAQRDTAAAVAEARQSTAQDRGENDIFPAAAPEMLEAKLANDKAGAAMGDGGAASPAALEALPAEARASIDAEASPILHAKISDEHERYATGKAEQDAAKREAHERTRAGITKAETDARTRQTEAQVAAHGEVSTARVDWQHEVDHIDQDVRAQATTARDQHRRSISNEQQNADRRAAEHIQSAEQQAEVEKRKAETEASQKKEEGKKESGGFFGWVKSKAKALIDGIKTAVNFIYDNLRKAVKAIFEACKKLALAVIELARKAIVGLIKAFGEILKGLVKVALAAFPQLRDRILRRIDQAVQRATQLVNSIADGLKQAVSALIDFLASTIDSILGLIQGLYNAALTVIGMLVSGEVAELMRKLGQVIAAAKTAPGQFETAAYEELLGGDLDQPLSPAELIAAGRTPPPDLVQQGDEAAPGESPQARGHGEDAADAEMPHPPWSEANVGVDEVARDETLDPDLVEEVQAHTGGGDGTVEFGESNDETRSLDVMLGRDRAQDAVAPATDVIADAAHQPTAQVASDGLTARERAAVKWQLMKKGLSDWWSKNWPYVLAGGVLGVAGFIVANILTGGAILAALPAIMTVVGYVMMGVGILKIVEHIRDFLQKSWNGDVRGGGKSLAKGLAAGAIELIMLLTFKVGEAAVRGARVAAGGVVRGAQAAARGTARAGRAAVQGAERGAEAMARSSVRVVSAIGRGAQYVIRAGKVLLRGAGRAIGQGVKRIRELGARLLARTRFKGFRIRAEGRRWLLEGRINPWVLLASGRIVEVKSVPEDTRLGSMVDDVVDGQPGRVVATGHEPPDVADVARAIGDAKSSPPEVQRALRKLEREADRIAELERKQAGGRRLGQQENEELRNLKNKAREPVSLSESDAFREARSDATRVMPPDAAVSPREVPYLEQAQRLMNELNKPLATFGDGSVAMSILGEQVAGGTTAKAILGETLHFAKGVDHLQPLYRLAQSGNLPAPAARRLLQEARKIEEAVAWARQYSRAVAAGAGTLDDLPQWAQAYRELLNDLIPR